MDKKTVIAVVMIIGLMIAWQYFTPSRPPQTAAPQKQAQTQGQTGQAPGAQAPSTEKQAAAPGAVPPAATPTVTPKPTKQITVETSKLRVVLSDLGGGITSVRLKEHKESVESTKGKELIEDLGPYKYMPAVSQFSNNKTANDATIFTADRGDIAVKDKPETLTFSGALTDGTKLRKTYTFYPDTYTVGLTVRTEGGAGQTQAGQTLTYADFALMSLKTKSSYIFKGPFVYDGRKLEQKEKIDPDAPINVGTAYNYTGFDEGYFSFIFMPRGTKPQLQITKAGDIPINRLFLDKGPIESTLYFVPNKVSLLSQLNIGAEKIVNFGWFDIIAKPMLWGMNWANKFTRNYGIDIILLTILIKIIFYPLSLKSYKSMKEMQKMQPVIAKLREKHKGDKEKLNKEMMDIYKTKGINPLGGCLPMVVQIPVFFALYKVLMGAIEFRHAPFLFWINDLASPENLYTLSVAGFSLPIRILPLIMGITMVIQQKMTPTSVDPMQEKMMLFMPVIFTFLFWGFPTGLVLYWLVNNVISIGQQYYINKKVA